ncbi:MAG: DUF4013 domain-containing protein [candidate division Zixibacteria bacterium]|nr:DUF4013 domain-containing protein [candidate division Zixibacteria bacterium]
MDNLGRAFTFMFEDKSWPGKVLLGGVFVLLSSILIGIPFVVGYLLELARRAYEGNEVPLPEWDNMGDKFTQGLIFSIILLIYSIPGIILQVVPCLGTCLGGIYAIAVALVLPHLMVRFAVNRDFNEAFKFEALFDFVKENIGDIVIVVLIALGMHIISWFGVILLVIGVFFTLFWACLGKAYLFGKLMQKVDSVAVVVEETTTDTPDSEGGETTER